MSQSVKFLSRNEFAERWGIAVRTIIDWDRKGINPVPPVKLGPGKRAMIRYRLTDIEKAEQ